MIAGVTNITEVPSVKMLYGRFPLSPGNNQSQSSKERHQAPLVQQMEISFSAPLSMRDCYLSWQAKAGNNNPIAVIADCIKSVTKQKKKRPSMFTQKLATPGGGLCLDSLFLLTGRQAI